MFASDWLDAGKLDHLRPFLGFVGDQFSEFGGCHRHRYNAQTDKVSFDFGIGHNGIDRAVELFDNFVGGVLGGNDTVPTARLVARHRFADGGDFRERFHTRGSGHPKGAQFTSSDVFDRRTEASKCYLHLSGEQIGHGTGAIWYMNQVNAGHHLE